MTPGRDCAVCHTPLDDLDTHPATCQPCVEQTNRLLRQLLTGWRALPAELGQLRAQRYDGDGRGGGDEHALPGGTVLALLAPGSTGGGARRLTPSDLARGAEGREHAPDNTPGDGDSIPGWLTSWEDDLRRLHGDPPSKWPASSPRAGSSAALYLAAANGWAAQHHPAYPELVRELRGLLARIDQALHRTRQPVRAGADCFDCGGALVRPVRKGLEVEDHVVCRTCHATYDGARYTLALAAERREALAGWLPLNAAALAARRPVKTIRAWAGTTVPVVCDVQTRVHLVWYPALAERDAQAGRRTRDNVE